MIVYQSVVIEGPHEYVTQLYIIEEKSIRETRVWNGKW